MICFSDAYYVLHILLPVIEKQEPLPDFCIEKRFCCHTDSAVHRQQKRKNL